MLKSLTFFIALFTIHCVVSQNTFLDTFNDSERSSKSNMRIEFNDKDGNEAHLPISIIKGKKEGPVFTIIAGVHGYEYPPIVATQGLMQEIDKEQLRGTLVIIPIASVASFYTRTSFINPQDNKNLNNAFPGKVDGTVTEQVAYYITTTIIPVTDVLLDIHGGDACEDLIPFALYYNNENKPEQTALAKKLCEGSGFEYVVSYPYTISDDEPAKYTFKQATQDGKTALSLECGKLGSVQEENVNLIKKAVYNMLETLDMYDNGSGAHPNITYRNNQDYIKSKAKGIFYSDFKAGDTVKKDEIIGYTTDEFGTVIEEYKSPKDGIILYKLGTPPININDTVMCISSNDN